MCIRDSLYPKGATLTETSYDRLATIAQNNDLGAGMAVAMKDLGPVALPRVPASLQPFTVAEYFPTQGITPYHDPRQHAVSLAYVVPVTGDCRPRQDALDLVWFLSLIHI